MAEFEEWRKLHPVTGVVEWLLDCFDSRLTFFLIYLSLCYYGRVLHVCVSTGFFAIIETCFYFLYG